VRRKQGVLLPLEVSILETAIELQHSGEKEFHGFAIAKTIKEHGEARALTAHGTLYKALGRMETAGLLDSRWEDALVAAAENRPRRRLYHVTGLGEKAFSAAAATQREAPPRLEEGFAPS
jgi:DNA-binding PadR family transcriptional regulator